MHSQSRSPQQRDSVTVFAGAAPHIHPGVSGAKPGTSHQPGHALEPPPQNRPRSKLRHGPQRMVERAPRPPKLARRVEQAPPP